jgi:acyl carrier protein
MRAEDVRTIVHEYIQKEFIFDKSQKLNDDQSLLGSGVLDSTGVLELIGFLQEQFQVDFLDSDLVADNFDSVNRISEFLSKRNETGGSASDAVA